MKIPKISIIIPNLNGAHFLANCLNSIKKQTFLDFEVIIVDNGSTDHSIQTIEDIYPESIIYKFSENTGFARAVNKGISLSCGEYIFLLNNDTELKKDCLQILKDFLDNNKDADYCATKMLYFDERNKINSSGDIFTIYGIAHKRGDKEIDYGQYDQKKITFGACAGAAFYRKKIFQETGLFDEDFFAYLEDVDLSFRANLLGFKCWYVPEAIVYHVDGGTSKKIKDFSFFLIQRNSLMLILKNLPTGIMIKITPTLIIGQIRALTSGLKHKKLKLIITSYFYILKNFSKIIKKRRYVQKNRKIKNSELWKLLEKRYPFNIKRSITG